jgi:hypothetical protein
VLQGADAERGDTVSELVKGDDATRRGGRDGGQLLFAEADGERQQRRAPQPGQPEDGDPGRRIMR